MNRYIIGLFVVLVFASCTKKALRYIRNKADLEINVPSDLTYSVGHYSGLQKVLDSNEVSSVILIHGIREKKKDHWHQVKKKIFGTDTFGQATIIARDSSGIVGNNEIGPLPWEVLQTSFKKENGREIHVIEIFWSPITSRVKEFLLKYDESEYRTGVAQWLKHDLFLDAFVDLGLYSNDYYHERMLRAVRAGFESIPSGSTETAVIGGGLGSQLVMDYFHDLKITQDSALAFTEKLRACVDVGHLESIANSSPFFGSDTSAFRAAYVPVINQAKVRLASVDEVLLKLEKGIKEQTREKCHNLNRIFLISNQIPFTALFNLKSDSLRRLPEDHSSILQNFQEYARNSADTLQVVAFFDEDDPFGFRMLKTSEPRLKVVNVRTQNSVVWEFDPQGLMQALNSIPVVDPDGLYGIVDETKRKQKLLLSLDAAQETARSDRAILDAIMEGSGSRRNEIKSDLFFEPPVEIEDKLINEPKKPNLGLGKTLGLASSALSAGFGSSILPFRNPSYQVDSIYGGIAGMESAIDTARLTQVLLIHGMRTKPPNHYEQTISSLVKELDFYITPVEDSVYYFNDEITGQTSSVRVLEFQDKKDRRIRFLTLYWSPMTTDVKNWLKGNSDLDQASRATGLLKREIITDGLGDVAVMINGYSKAFDSLASFTFQLMAERDSATNFMLSGSLGSWLLFDYVNRNSGRNVNDQNVGKVLCKTPEWFMFTNQLGLINITKIDRKLSLNDYYQRILGEGFTEAKYPTKLIAFGDPNDFLTFELPDSSEHFDIDSPQVINAYLNTASGLRMKMDGLIKLAYKADRVWLKKCAKKDLRSQQRSARKYCKKTHKSPGEHDHRCTFLTKSAAGKYYDELIKECVAIDENDLRRACENRFVKRSNFKKLTKPGVITGALRRVATGQAIQNFVVNLPEAHEGPSKNPILLKMIAHGSQSVDWTFRKQHFQVKPIQFE